MTTVNAAPPPAVRRLRPGDADDYRALMLEAYARHPEAFTSTAAERAALSMDWWRRRLAGGEEPHELVHGAFSAGSLVAVAGLRFNGGARTRHKATLFGMYVQPSARRGGLGRALVEAVLAAARNRAGVTLVQLTVSDGNQAARALYESCGFVAWGVEPRAVALDDGFVAKVHLWREAGVAAPSL